MSYPVLAPVSEGYPKDWGRLLTCYSPVRRSSTPERAFPLDLHVLSTPPAFVLSQDQTLQQKPRKLTPDNKQKVAKGIKRGNKSSITWHWLIKHPVEFSKNNHTPPTSRPSRAARPRGTRSTLLSRLGSVNRYLPVHTYPFQCVHTQRG